jgi:hypothetical protein
LDHLLDSIAQLIVVGGLSRQVSVAFF